MRFPQDNQRLGSLILLRPLIASLLRVVWFPAVDDEPGWLYEANSVLHPRGSEYDVQFVVNGLPLTENRSPALLRLSNRMMSSRCEL